MIFISACSGGGSAPASDPGISNFSAASTTISLGSSTDLTVEFVGGTGVINNGIGEVTSGTAISVSPTTTTTYLLTVTNSAGSIAVTSFATITIVPSIIESFTATSTTIIAGDSVDLTATFITDGTGNIDNGIGTYTSNSLVSVSPLESTTYTLTVTNSLGESVTATVTVTVVALSSLTVLNESLGQIFQVNQSTYTASVGFLAKSIQINATSADAGASITVNGVAIGADGLSQLIDLTEGADTMITIVVTQNTVSKTYTVTISRALAATFAEQAYITASNTDGGDEFGYSVALSGDTLVVGAYLEDSSSDIAPDETAIDSGAVYVFTRSGGTWTQQAYLKASNIGTTDNFGISVALSGDTLAVGATGEQSASTGINSTPDDTVTLAGAVYVFVRNGTNWNEQAYLKGSNTEAGDEFGISVALSGNTLAVGAHKEDSSTTGIGTSPDEAAGNAGAVYVYIRNDTTWSEQAYIKASNTQALDLFGFSVALDGDTLAIGAYNEDSGTTGVGTTSDESEFNSGAVYVFVRNNVSWSEQAYIKASNTEGGNTSGAPGDNFGYSVALSGDTLAVGAWLEDSSTNGIDTTEDNAASAAGAAYVFARNNTIWSEQAYIKASNSGKSDLFGKSVALSGDVLVVGAQQEDTDIPGINQGLNDAAKDFGVVYVYIRDGTTWSEQTHIKPSTTISGDKFGTSVALSGDSIAVGVPLNSTSAGAVYTFE